MAGFSRYASREILDHVFKVGAYTPATNLYVALYNAGPTECTGTGYAREICNAWDAATDADPSVVDNTNIIDFGNGAADWGTLTHFAILDNSSGGNLITDITALTASKAVGAGDPVTFAAGALQVTLD